MVRTAARLPNGTRISDHVALGVLTTTIPADLVDAVLAETGGQSRRQRRLPARLVVYYVLALALYAQASYGEVLRCLLEGVRWLHPGGEDPAPATKSAITRARRRLGVTPLERLFQRLAHPFAGPGTPGAWYPLRRPRHAGGLVSWTPAGQPGRHHHRPARHPGAGGALRPAGRVTGRQRLPAAAPARAD
jgi:hypothetical protein